MRLAELPSLLWPLLWRRRIPVAIFFLLVLILPALEATSFSLVYLLLSADQAVTVVQKISDWIGWAVVHTNHSTRIIVLAASFATVGLWAVCRYLRALIQTKMRLGIYEDEFADLVYYYLALPGKAADRENRHDVANAMVSQAGVVANYTLAVLNIAFSSVAILILVATTILYAPFLTPLALALASIAVIVNARSFARLRTVGVAKVESTREVIQITDQILRGYERIKFDSLEEATVQKAKGVVRRAAAWRESKALTIEKISVVSESVGWLAITVIVFLGTVVWNLSAATFVLLLLVFNRLRGTVGQVQTSIMIVRELGPGVRQETELTKRLKKLAEPQEPAGVVGFDEIQLSGVSFAYDATPIIQDVSLTLRSGDRVVVQGRSGQGKSTLLRLIMGFYRPDAGMAVVSSGGRSLPLEFARIRENLFYCGNELYVFDGSLRDALDPARKVPDSAVRMALESSALLTGADDLKAVLEMSVGPDGGNLSLGQRQRLLLARFYLKTAKLVVLDEVASNMDLETEQAVLEKLLNSAAPDSIIIVVAHRIHPALNFNRTIIVDEGRVVCEGALAPAGT